MEASWFAGDEFLDVAFFHHSKILVDEGSIVHRLWMSLYALFDSRRNLAEILQVLFIELVELWSLGLSSLFECHELTSVAQNLRYKWGDFALHFVEQVVFSCTAHSIGG